MGTSLALAEAVESHAANMTMKSAARTQVGRVTCVIIHSLSFLRHHLFWGRHHMAEKSSACFHFPPDEIECVTEDDDNQPQKVPSEHEDHLN